MFKPHPNPSHRLTCTEVRFVEVNFPRLLRPRLAIESSEGLSFLLEDQAAISLAAEFIVIFCKHLAESVTDATPLPVPSSTATVRANTAAVRTPRSSKPQAFSREYPPARISTTTPGPIRSQNHPLQLSEIWSRNQLHLIANSADQIRYVGHNTR